MPAIIQSVLLGMELAYFNMADYGIRFAKKNQNVLTALDKDVPFSTKFNTLKLWLWGNLTVDTNGSGNGDAVFTHDLNYAPAFMVFRKTTAQFTLLSGATTYPNSFFPVGVTNYYLDYGSSGLIVPTDYAYTTATTLVCSVRGGPANSSVVFRYYLLVDRSESFSGDEGPGLLNDYGFKFAKTGGNVLTDKEYQLSYSTKYKALQYYKESTKTETLTLPAMFASFADQDVEAGTYVDINHGLGYAPLFMVRAENGDVLSTDSLDIPYAFRQTDISPLSTMVGAFCDATRVRIFWYRRSVFNSITQAPVPTFPEKTITVKVNIFTENLAGDSH